MQEEFLQPTKRQKKEAWLVLLIGLGIGIGSLFYFSQALFATETSFDTAPAQMCLQLKNILIQLLLLFLCACTGFSIYFLFFARRVVVQQQFPPRGTLLLHRTPLYRGAAAQRRAGILRVFSGVLFTVGIAVSVLGFQFAATFTCGGEHSRRESPSCAA